MVLAQIGRRISHARHASTAFGIAAGVTHQIAWRAVVPNCAAVCGRTSSEAIGDSCIYIYTYMYVYIYMYVYVYL